MNLNSSYDTSDFIKKCSELNITLSDQQIMQFLKYYELLIEWNSFMNLTAITNFDEVILKHFIDSISLCKYLSFGQNDTLIDIGTGAGFPGIPIKIICPGKTFRRDDDDMTHSHQFAQIEGLVIDKNINLGNLKATLELFAQKMFSKDSKVRFRSSYFPFTEPSVEVDISCFNCHGKGCPTCKGTGWIEILGAGMVHPNVLKMSGYDPEIYSGYAFGVGIERVTMLRYGVDDIRKFYQSDIRFIEEFNKKVEE